MEEKLTSNATAVESPAAHMGSSGLRMAVVEVRGWTFVFLNQLIAGSWLSPLVA